MPKLSVEHATIIREQCARIHAAVNHGTLDSETVNEALAQLARMVRDDDPPGGSNGRVKGPAEPARASAGG